jgi:sugar-phosphatase
MADVSHTDAAHVYANARALLIDLDGTLIDSTAPILRAWTGFSERHGMDAEQVIRFAQGRPGRETVRLLIPDGDYVNEADIIEEAEVTDTDGVTALPGALDILTSGRTLAIVTSCTMKLLTARLAAAGLPEPAIKVTSDDITHGKPDPECFLLGAERLGVPPADCVVLEDAPAGITAGKASGATVIAMVSTHPAEDLGEADFVVDDLTVLLADA